MLSAIACVMSYCAGATMVIFVNKEEFCWIAVMFLISAITTMIASWFSD